MLMPNKKKIASVIVAGMSKPKDDHVQKLGEESDTGSYELPEKEEESVGLESAMDSLMKAFAAKDAKAMAKAFRNALVLCEDGEAESEAG